MTRPDIPEKTRIALRQRSKWNCEDCGVHLPWALEAHHLHYQTVGEETVEDLAHLCRKCHLRRHVDVAGNFWADPEEMAIYWDSYHQERGKE